MSGALKTVARWLRGGYPKWAPRRGHVPLVALCGIDEAQLKQELRSTR